MVFQLILSHALTIQSLATMIFGGVCVATKYLLNSGRDSKKHYKRRSGYNMLDTVVQNLARQKSPQLPRKLLGDLERE